MAMNNSDFSLDPKHDDFRFSDKQLQTAATLTLISSLLSLFGGLSIIWSYSRIVAVQNRVRELLVCLTIADICTAFGNGFGSVRWFHLRNNYSMASKNLCIGQSFITTTSNMMSFNWTTAIAVYLFCCVWLRRNPKFSMRWYLFMHLLLWGIPASITLTALHYHYLGSNGNKLAGVWCWLNLSSDTSTGKIWLLLSGKGWEILTYLIIAVLYILMKTETYIQRKRHEVFYWHHIHQELRREDEIYCFSCLILYCLRFWGTLRFIMDIVGNSTVLSPIYDTQFRPAFLYLQSFGDSGQAFFNFLLFCVWDSTVRSYICLHAFQRRHAPVDDASNSSSGLINSHSGESEPLLNTA